MAKTSKGNALGISLILMMFILLCLITFATLSFLLARADNELSVSSTENVIEFYTADQQAQENLEKIDCQLAELYQAQPQTEDYVRAIQDFYQQDSGIKMQCKEDCLFLQFETAVSDKEKLISTLEVYSKPQKNYYRIDSWVLEPIA